jgi:hypothetical protein
MIKRVIIFGGLVVITTASFSQITLDDLVSTGLYATDVPGIPVYLITQIPSESNAQYFIRTFDAVNIQDSNMRYQKLAPFIKYSIGPIIDEVLVGCKASSLSQRISELLIPSDDDQEKGAHPALWYLNKTKNYVFRDTIKRYYVTLKLAIDSYRRAGGVNTTDIKIATEALEKLDTAMTIWAQYDKDYLELLNMVASPSSDKKMVQNKLKALTALEEKNQLLIIDDPSVSAALRKKVKDINDTKQKACDIVASIQSLVSMLQPSVEERQKGAHPYDWYTARTTDHAFRKDIEQYYEQLKKSLDDYLKAGGSSNSDTITATDVLSKLSASISAWKQDDDINALSERVKNVITLLAPLAETDKADEIAKGLSNKDLIQIEHDIMQSNATHFAMVQNARGIYELIDDLLTRYISLEQTKDDISGDSTALLREQYALMQILADQFNLFSFISKPFEYKPRPSARIAADDFLKDAFDWLALFIKDPRIDISTIMLFKNVKDPLAPLVKNVSIESSQLVEPLAQFLRAWRWYQAVGGSSLFLNARIWNVAWWQEAARKAQDALRERETKDDEVVGLKQDFWNKVAQLDYNNALVALANYQKSKPEIKEYNELKASLHRLQEDNSRMEQINGALEKIKNSSLKESGKNTAYITILRQELNDSAFKKMVDNYARREELFTLAPAKAYSYEARQGAKKIYSYVDSILARFISSFSTLVSLQDIALMKNTYQYLTDLNETYGMNQGWFGTSIGAATAEAQVAAENKLNEDVLVAYNLIIVPSPNTQEVQKALDRLTLSLQQYQAVNGKASSFVVDTVLPRLKTRLGKK